MAGRSVLVSLVVAAALAVPAVAAARPFQGAVGPGATISLKRANGSALKHASPGEHRFAISDQSSFHNFHLLGPGVNRRTTVAGRGTVTWNLTLGAGKFSFRSDPQARRLKGSFTVTA